MLGKSHRQFCGIPIFATPLTWMEEHESPVFIAATANLTTLDVLPPEFIQRFSEVFWVDKPNDAEWAQILNVHLKDRGLNPDGFDVARCHARYVWDPNFREVIPCNAY